MRRFLLLLLAVVLAGSLIAAAQEFPRVSATFGYSYARNQSMGAIAYNFNGWNGEATLNANHYFGFTTSISGGYHSVSGSSEKLKVYHFLFGPQFTYRGEESRVQPFGRFLFGASKAEAGYATLAGSSTEFSYGLGGGLDAKLSSHVAARLFQADFIRTHFGGTRQNDVRLGFGFTVYLGNKTK